VKVFWPVGIYVYKILRGNVKDDDDDQIITTTKAM
jgi:hypothetical protein